MAERPTACTVKIKSSKNKNSYWLYCREGVVPPCLTVCHAHLPILIVAEYLRLTPTCLQATSAQQPGALVYCIP